MPEHERLRSIYGIGNLNFYLLSDVITRKIRMGPIVTEFLAKHRVSFHKRLIQHGNQLLSRLQVLVVRDNKVECPLLND